MAERTVIEQLDLAVQALLDRREAHAAQPSRGPAEIAPLTAIAAALRDMPSEQFQQRLRADLQRRAQMASTAIAVPETQPTMAPYLCVRNAAAALDFYKRAFGATELMRLTQPDGKVAHAEIQVAGAVIMLADELPQYGFISPQTLGGSPLKIYLYFDDVDAVVPQAVAAGATLARPISDEFYGERSGQVTDPFGFTWILSTRKEVLTAQEIERRFDALMKQQAEPEAAQREPAQVREGFHTVTPYLVVDRPDEFLAFMKQAFGAEEIFRAPGSAGGMHVELRIGDSMVMAGGGAPVGVPATPSALHLYVPDADAAYRRAIDAGATSLYEPMDMPYGDREGGIKDGFGNAWYIATHKATGHRPKGMGTVTPTLHPHGADSLIDFLKRGLAGEEAACERSPDGMVMHASVRIGDSLIEIGEARGPIEPTACMLLLCVPDVDAAYRRALAAGAVSIETPADQPYGERRAGVKDAHDNSWYFSAPIARGLR